MARRSHLHLTEVASLALSSSSSSSTDLSSFGVGSREGWLDDASLLLALSPHRHALALARISHPLILVLASDATDYALLTRIRPSLADSEEGSLAAIEWVPDLSTSDHYDADHDRDDTPHPVLAVGTTLGYLMFYSLAGELIHKQSIYPARIISLNYRQTAAASASASAELSVVFSTVIARFDGFDIQGMLQKWSDESGSRTWKRRFQEGTEEEDESAFANVPFQLWNVNKFGSCADAAIVGLMPPPLLELQSSQRYYCAVTIGEDSVISAYRLSENRNRSLVGAILSKVGTATISTISSFSSIIWRREPSPTKKARPKPQSFAKDSVNFDMCERSTKERGEINTLSQWYTSSCDRFSWPDFTS